MGSRLVGSKIGKTPAFMRPPCDVNLPLQSATGLGSTLIPSEVGGVRRLSG
jgi:hypothetical protein